MEYVFPCSEDGTRYLAQRYPRHCGKIQTMYLGTEDHGVQKKEADHFFTVISCSRLIGVKRVERIVDALALLNIPCRWVHFGGGDLLEDLQEKAPKKLQPTSITWEITGTLPNDEVLKRCGELYADCFVNVSENEGLPLSIMEAMSFGGPVIVTDVHGTSGSFRRSQGRNSAGMHEKNGSNPSVMKPIPYMACCLYCFWEKH